MDGTRTVAQDFSVFVASGRFHSASFRKGASPLPPGKQKVHVLTHFNNNWQSESVLKLVGSGGSKLKASGVIHSEDAQLIDADKVLDHTLNLIVPPISADSSQKDATSQSRSTDADKAIAVVKKALLTVDGSRSSETVEGGVLFYFKAPGIRMGNGWSATAISRDTYNVSLDFINTVGNKEQHDSALWEVHLDTKKVLYRNTCAF